jgi:hypothetical protein
MLIVSDQSDAGVITSGRDTLNLFVPIPRSINLMEVNYWHNQKFRKQNQPIGKPDGSQHQLIAEYFV